MLKRSVTSFHVKLHSKPHNWAWRILLACLQCLLCSEYHLNKACQYHLNNTSNNNNNRFIAPHLIRALSAYKDIRICSFHHTHPHTHTHTLSLSPPSLTTPPLSLTHTHTHTYAIPHPNADDTQKNKEGPYKHTCFQPTHAIIYYPSLWQQATVSTLDMQKPSLEQFNVKGYHRHRQCATAASHA